MTLLRYFVACLLCWFLTICVHAQVTVEKINFGTAEDPSYVPRITAQNNGSAVVAKKINEFLTDRFLIESLDPDSEENFRWSDMDFEYEIKDDILYLSWQGEYYGAYPNWVSEINYFDLKTGEELILTKIPLPAAFSLKGYHDFIEKYWISGVNRSFKEAEDCADMEPYCSRYDIDYGFSATGLSVSLTDDCYARVARACSPDFDIKLRNDQIAPYLSGFAKKYFVGGAYHQLKGVDRYQYAQKIRPQLPNRVYLFGKIGGKYPFSMALEFPSGSDEVAGYYYYHSNGNPINLSGKVSGTSLNMTETVGGKMTGEFSLQWDDEYQSDAIRLSGLGDDNSYLIGTWSSGDDSRRLPVVFTDVLFNDRR